MLTKMSLETLNTRSRSVSFSIGWNFEYFGFSSISSLGLGFYEIFGVGFGSIYYSVWLIQHLEQSLLVYQM